MALNASGPIALAGSTVGVSIAAELALGTATQISINDTAVRTLAGVPSGAIIMPTNFYGKSSSVPTGLYYAGIQLGCAIANKVTRINACGAIIGSETTVGTSRFFLAGAKVGSNGLFYGGCTNNAGAKVNQVTRINISGVLVGSETTAGTARVGLAGALVGTNGLFYGGYIICGTNRVTRINACGAIVGLETTAGTERWYFAGAKVGTNGLFYGGIRYIGCCVTNFNRVTRINACGAIVGSETNIGTIRCSLAGALVGTNGLFYGGCINTFFNNTLTRINACGALVGSETTIGTARASLSGATVGSNGMFYGGNITCGVSNKVTRINACGAIVGSETTVGTARVGLAGAGL